ncbi:hypothetical protein H9L17_04805 [Thermomonas brevis]|uniref:Uncharacterized protein n=1 Tax=Thermomonas brevis TaxID=215691 RepID=A0A7G9QVT6_9GAMM|nr:hypothetical protein [Thermomonas brevis]QNN47461.1 hypothetical protein H9L17_04805 [Thermomonas brevis]
MTLLAIPAGSILILIAISLLFVKRPASGTNWPSFIAKCLLFATLVLFSWAWQYNKFLNKHGAYNFSQTHGGMLETAFHIIMLAVIFVFLWRHHNAND